MKVLRFGSVAAVAAATIVALTLSAVPASAVTTCTVTPSLPDQLVIASSEVPVDIALSDPGHCAGSVQYTFERTDGAAATVSPLVFGRGALTGTIYFDALADGAGEFIVTGGHDDASMALFGVQTIAPDSNTMTAKFASWASFSISRPKRTQTAIKVNLSAYTVGAFRFAGWRSATVKVQVQRRGKWVAAKTLRTDGSGHATALIKTTKAKHAFRLVVPNSAATWGLTSNSKNG